MEIKVDGLKDLHEKAINKGFAPWNYWRLFKHKDGTVLRMVGVAYACICVYATFNAAGKEFVEDITHKIDDYELLEKELNNV